VNAVDDDGKVQTPAVHTLIMLAWEGPCPPDQQVRHHDDNPDHNWWMPGGEAAILAGGVGGLVYGDLNDQWQDKVRNRARDVPSPRGVRAAVRNALSRLRWWSP
jgi:hypothetical protein